jgi:hypothetical protein
MPKRIAAKQSKVKTTLKKEERDWREYSRSGRAEVKNRPAHRGCGECFWVAAVPL